MKYIAIAAIWLGYATMVTTVAYWVKNPNGIIFVPVLFGGFFAVISIAIVAATVANDK